MPLFESPTTAASSRSTKPGQVNGIGPLKKRSRSAFSKGINVREIVNGIQPIAFENAGWAYVVGAAIAVKRGAEGRRRR